LTDVLILASHQAFGERLEAFVRDQLRCTVTGLASDAVTALELIQATSPDVALIDVAVPGGSGFELAQRLITLHPAARVVLMGDGEPAEYVSAAARAGALAYMPKTDVSQHLPDLLGITPSAPESMIRRRNTAISPRRLVLESVLAGGVLMSGVALGQPAAALAGAVAVLLLLHWHSARGRRSPYLAGSAPVVALASPVPSGRLTYRADGVRGSPERSEDLSDSS
jgi:CheY-like chemotaxis protein